MLTIETLLTAVKHDLAELIRTAVRSELEVFFREHPPAQIPSAHAVSQQAPVPERKQEPRTVRKYNRWNPVPKAVIDEIVAEVRAGARVTDVARKFELADTAVSKWCQKAKGQEPKATDAPEPQGWQPPAAWKLVDAPAHSEPPPPPTFDLEELLPLDGARIREERLKRNLNQTQLGDLLGLSQTAISLAEREGRIPPAGRIAFHKLIAGSTGIWPGLRGHQIKDERVRRGMTTKQFASELGITPGLLGTLESGHTVPSARVQETFVGLMAETPRPPLPEPEGGVERVSGARFLNERLKAGLRIQEFGELLGIGTERLADLETGDEPTDAECAALFSLCGTEQQAA